jgi:hypothetical protein
MEVEAFRKSEQGAGLFQHFRGGAGCVLAHSVCDQIFRRNGQELITTGCVEQAHPVEISQPIKQGGTDDFKAELQFWMNPSPRHHAGSAWANKAMCLQGRLKSILTGDNVEIPCGNRPTGIKFSRRTTDQNGRAETLRVHMLTDGGEDFERGCKGGAIGSHAGAVMARNALL